MSYQATDRDSATGEGIKGKNCPPNGTGTDGVIPHDPNIARAAFINGAATGALGVLIGSLVGLVLVGTARKLL